MPVCYKKVQILAKIHLGPKLVNRPKIMSLFKDPLEESWGLVIFTDFFAS